MKAKANLEKIKYFARNSFNVVPGFGFIGYAFGGNDRDIEKGVSSSKRQVKASLWALYGLLGSVYLTSFSVTGESNPLKLPQEVVQYQNKFSQKKMYRENVFQIVSEFVDKDKNGFSKQEQYTLDTLMEVQNEPSSYKPDFKDWERAYNKLKCLE